MKQKVKVSLFVLIFLLINVLINSMPFLGGFYFTDNYFQKNKFTTNNKFSFFIDNKFNNYFKLYSRFTFNFNFFADYKGDNARLNNFSLIPNIDLLYLEFKTIKDDINYVDYEKGFVNFNMFSFKIGRIQISQGSSFIISMKGDGLDTYFTIKNFKFDLFAITNSFDYGNFFDFMNSESRPVFTRWDLKRYSPLSNYYIKDNDYGFVGDTTSLDYNYYFNSSSTDYYSDLDYTSKEKTRLNKLRFAAVLAGRIFTGFSFEIMRIYFQNFSFNFLANIDLIPEDFVVTYPSRVDDVQNTFGGKYTSFYFNFSANGKIYAGLHYSFDAVYETGYNATYNDNGVKIKYSYALINSFAIYTKFSYYFESIAKPSINLSFSYAHGDEDAELVNGAVYNRSGQDNNFRAVTKYSIGYVIDPDFSNICAVGFNYTLRPFALVKNPVFSRILLDNGVLLILRPLIKGSSFLSEKVFYLKDNKGYERPEKAYLGFEIDLSLSWQIFSDLSFKFNSGIFIPNYYIYNGDQLFWKVGIMGSYSF